MTVEKRSLSFPPDLWSALEDEAQGEEVSVSRLVVLAVEDFLAIRQGLRVVDAWEEEHGPFSEAEVAAARRRLADAGVGGPSRLRREPPPTEP